MAERRHKVQLTVPNAMDMVGNTDVVFRVTTDGRLVGTVRISRGAIDFTKSGGRRFRLKWDRFAELMELEGQKLRSKPIPTRVARRRG
jgi:hypothetical protein